MKLRLPRLRPPKPPRPAAPKRVIGGSRLDPDRIEAARERLRREIPRRADEE